MLLSLLLVESTIFAGFFYCYLSRSGAAETELFFQRQKDLESLGEATGKMFFPMGFLKRIQHDTLVALPDDPHERSVSLSIYSIMWKDKIVT